MAHLLTRGCGGGVVHGAQQREQHLPEALLPGPVAQPRALAGHHSEQRPHAAVAHLRPGIRAQPLHRQPHELIRILMPDLLFELNTSQQRGENQKESLAGVLTCRAPSSSRNSSSKSAEGRTGASEPPLADCLCSCSLDSRSAAFHSSPIAVRLTFTSSCAHSHHRVTLSMAQ